MNLLDKLVADIEADVKAATPEVFELALAIMDQHFQAAIQQSMQDPGSISLYKILLGEYTAYKLMWHRFHRRMVDEVFWRPVHWRHSEVGMARSIRRAKQAMMQQFQTLRKKYPGITYRELNTVSKHELIRKWCN
jgi:hypothetical protein